MSAASQNPNRGQYYGQAGDIFFGGKRVAMLSPGAASAKYYVTDNLGSTSLVTDAAGNVLNESLYFPYGTERVVELADASNHYKYTGKERDAETGLDNFGARFYTDTLGRFMSPDWEAKPTAVPYASFGDPQTLNLYSYVENGPLNRVDADGHGWSDYYGSRWQPQRPYWGNEVCLPEMNGGCTGDYLDMHVTGGAGDGFMQLELCQRAADHELAIQNATESSANSAAQQQGGQNAIGGDGVPSNRLTRDANGNLVYTNELYGGPFSTCDSCLHVSDPYGAPRDNGTTQHGGIDLATGGKTGIDVLSQTDGKVIQVGASGFGPHSVTMQSPAGTYFTYGHLASNSVKVGDSIKAGTPLGQIGNLGNSTGIHVHIQASTVSPWGPTSRMLGITFP